MNVKLFIIASIGLYQGVSAQKLSKMSVPKNQTSSTMILLNQRNVVKIYEKLDQVYTLDFRHATSKSLNQEQLENTKKILRTADYVDYSNTQAIGDLLSIQPEALSIIIPFKGTELLIDLVKVDLFDDNFSINSNQPEMVKGVKTGVYYQGMIRNENTLASFSFFENEFSGFISTSRNSDHIIELGKMESFNKSTNGQDGSPTHIIYSDDDLLINVHHSCGSEALEQYHNAVDQLENEDFTHASTEKAANKCVTYFWETSYNLFQSKGSTVNVTNYMTSLFNNFQLIYNNEQIGSKLNQLYIWTSTDPYANSLNIFSSNRTAFGANIATLFSTTGGGGVAWLDVLCGSSEYYKHGFCGSVGQNFNNVPNYSWPVNVTSHEIGHNLGSPHTHSCSWSGGAIDGCGPAAGYSEGCTGPIPSDGGTMMSYCHLVSVGVNLAFGFGSQPGNLIRNRVNSCISLTCDSGGGSACTNAYEPNEIQSTAISLNSGIAVSAAIASSTDTDYYKISVSNSSDITFVLTGPSGVDYDIFIYSSGGIQIGSGTGSTASETTVLTNLSAGTYAIKVIGYNGENSLECYTIKATAVTLTNCITAFEPNESVGTATPISLNTTISSAISTSTDNDYFKVIVTSSGTYTFNLVGPSGADFDMLIYNSSNVYIGVGNSYYATESVTLSGVDVGTYYIRINGYNGSNSTTCYTLNAAKTGASISNMDRNSIYTLWPNPASDKLMIQSSGTNEELNLEVIDINGQILSTHHLMTNNTVDVSKLQAGIYFIRIVTAENGNQQLKFIKL